MVVSIKFHDDHREVFDRVREVYNNGFVLTLCFEKGKRPVTFNLLNDVYYFNIKNNLL